MRGDPLDSWLVDQAGQPSALGALVREWHLGLADDRGGRAALRRAMGVSEAFDAAPFLRLCAEAIRLHRAADREQLAERLAAIALAVAEIDHDDTALPPGRAFAEPAGRGKALTGARLHLLAGTAELGLFLRLLRGAVAQTGRRQSVLATAELVRRWQMAPHVRERARRRLILDYVAHASDATFAGNA
jgi:hypothetical protein